MVTPGHTRSHVVANCIKSLPEAGGADEAAVDVGAGGVLAAVVAGDAARVDDAHALRHRLGHVLPETTRSRCLVKG